MSTPTDSGTADPDRIDPDGEVVAALDIGTNSFHLVVARPRSDGFETITRDKEMVRLGQGGTDMRELQPAAIDRAVGTLARMRRLAQSHGARVLRAVATSATREAANASVLIDRARDEAGVEIEVISGTEEARLIYLGVLQAVPVFEVRTLCVDIGGGSTELLIGERSEVLAVRSLKLGAVRLTDRYFPGGELSGKSVRECRTHIRSMLTHFEREVHQHGFTSAVASSGTAESIARMVRARRGDDEPRTFNCFAFSADELHSVVDELCAARTVSQRTRLDGLESSRADIAPAGALILDEVVRTLGVAELTFSEGALREGVLLDTVQRRFEHLSSGLSSAMMVAPLRDVTDRSVRQLQERCDDDPAHSDQVARLALELFDALEPALALGPDARRYLEAAARLANVGLVVSHSKHHVHSYYVIRNSELAGLTDHEIELIAQVARYHRKSTPKQSHIEFNRLSDADQHLVRGLAAVLRVAIGLDRCHEARVSGVRTEVAGDVIRIGVRSEPQIDIALELYAANDRKGLLEDVTGRRVELLPAVG